MTSNKMIKGPLSTYNINDKSFLTSIVNEDSKQLREGIIGNRLHKINQRNVIDCRYSKI
jgi:hypothetical protein